MTAEADLLAATCDAAHRVAARLSTSIASLSGVLPINGDDIDALDDTRQMQVDAFLKRWEQLQDALSNRMIRAIFAVTGEATQGLSARDAFERAESLKALGDAARFTEIARLRNRLTHEYPMDDGRRAARLNAAWALAPVLIDEHDRLSAYALTLLSEGDAS